MLAPYYAYFQSLTMLVSKISPLKLSNLCCLGLLPFLPLEMLKGSDSGTDLGFQDHLDNFFGDYIVAPLSLIHI